MIGPHKYIIKYKGKPHRGFAAQKAASILLKYPEMLKSFNVEIYITKS